MSTNLDEMVAHFRRTFVAIEHQTIMSTGTAPFACETGLEESRLIGSLGAGYAEWDEEQPWGQRSFWDRVLGVATISFLSAGGWAAIIFAIRLFW
jgi:hypothetical protein